MTSPLMNAWTLDGYGADTDGFMLSRFPRPAPGPGEVLIRVRASSYNPIESKIRVGALQFAPPFPAILNGDVAGRIEAIGSGVDAFAIGDLVYGCCGGFLGHQGALAEYMVARAESLARMPEELSFEEAAALPIASITAWYALVDRAKLKRGERVLILGGTGGVGHVGVQLAVALGADVVAACGTDEKCAVARSLGAAEAYNYHDTDIENVVQRYTEGEGFDLVFDTAGGSSLGDALRAARFGGQVATIGARGSHDLSPGQGRGVTLHMVMMLDAFVTGRGWAHYGEILREVAELVSAGQLRPLVDSARFTFDRVGEAHDYAAMGIHAGKIALSYPDSAELPMIPESAKHEG